MLLLLLLLLSAWCRWPKW